VAERANPQVQNPAVADSTVLIEIKNAATKMVFV
jgi:hypothetical protein